MSVLCLVVLVVLGVIVGVVEVFGVVVVFSAVSSSEVHCSSRDCWNGPVRALRVCIASGVSLPLESVGDVLTEEQYSSKSALICCASMLGVLCVCVCV